MERNTERTLVYTDGGDTYHGEQANRPLDAWKEYGREHNQLWLYKGHHYFSEGKQVVVVFTRDSWDRNEIKRRKANGFKGIREYRL